MNVRTNSSFRVAVIGAGRVGTAFAFALVRSAIASDIVLVDTDRERAAAEVMNLDHSVPFGPPVRITSGDYSDCAGANVIVITAGAAQVPGESRLSLTKRNATMLRSMVPELAKYASDAVVIVATNPVDVLTMGVMQLSGLPSSKVLGTGTILDTARLRSLLSKRFEVDARSVHAHVIGEHGDSEVVAWSAANVSGIPLAALDASVPFGRAEREAMARETREAAYAIVAHKGHTEFAIAAGLVRIVEAVARDERSALSVSVPARGAYGIDGVCLSLPCIVGRNGIESVLPLPLDATEVAMLRHSADVIREAGASVDFLLA